MARFSVIPLSKLYGAYRWDAECYEPDVLRDENALSGFPTVKLGSIATITDGQHGYHEVDDSSPIRHITARCIEHGIVSGTRADRLSKRTHDANTRSQLEIDDVLLSTAGTIGEAGIVASDILPANIDQDVARITLNEDAPVEPQFLVAFLLSELGQFQCRRATTGQIQGHISLAALRQFDIPILRNQKKISEIVLSGVAQRHLAIRLLAEAEVTLAEGLGLVELRAARQLTYTRPFSAVHAAARFDAEYFSPRYQEILGRLASNGTVLADAADLMERRFSPNAGQGPVFRYIEIGGIRGDGLADDVTIEMENAPSRAQWLVEKGDVITSTVRPIRRLTAVVTENQSGCVCSSGFAVLHPRADVAPEVLFTFLRLPVVCELLDLNTTASMYPAISTQRLMSMPFRLPTPSVCAKITKLVQTSFTERQRAAQLLDAATKLVETTILT
jgi:hypothetical protein